MKISIVTDELSADPETAFELGLEWGVSHFELRGVYDQRVPRLAGHVRQRLIRAIRSLGVTITAISPGLFKIPFPASEPQHSNLGWMGAGFHRSWADLRALLDDHQRNLLPEALDFAQEVGASHLIAFSFHRDGAPAGPAPQALVDVIASATQRAADRGMTLLIETEEGHWANTGESSAALARRINHPALGINWDPANACIDGDTPFPDGYASVRPFVQNVHFKDVHVPVDGAWTIVEEGDVDWSGQIAALVADHYTGAIAIEPHLSPSVSSTRKALERLRVLIKDAQH